MSDLKIRHLYKRYGALDILKDVNLDVRSGEFIAFVGPSGCGKSTLLRCISGLEWISDGTLEIDGAVVNDVAPAKRGIAMVFQSYALYPHMTVYENMAFSMRIAKADKTEIDKRVRQAADILQLTQYLDRLPKAMSGGQRQRVAIGRAIVRNPKVFLFDEPLSNLDAALRVATRIELGKLKESMPDTTMIYVTHDQVEAMTLADRIVVLRDGRVEQIGSPMELYRRPANLFVAQFIGSPAMNILPATLLRAGPATEVSIKGGVSTCVPIPTPAASQGEAVSFGVRPEDLTLDGDGDALFEGSVDYVEQLGEVQLVYVDIGRDGQPLIVKAPGNTPVRRGQGVRLKADAGDLHIFDKTGSCFMAHQAEAASGRPDPSPANTFARQ